MQLVHEFIIKYFKGPFQIYSRNFRLYSKCSTPLFNDKLPVSRNDYVQTSEFTQENVLKLISAPQDDEKLLKIINEVNYVIERKRRCPEILNSAEVNELYVLETKSQRMKYLSYLFKQEKVKEKDRLNKEKKIHNRVLPKDNNFECDFSSYGLSCKTLLLNVRRRSIINFYNKRVANSVLFGSKIVIDLEYDKYMVEKERRSCAAQLRHLITANRKDRNPFDLYICNASPTFKCVQYLKHDIPNIDDSLHTLCEESYLNIFPKENLVYLSPHANESLKYFDPSAIYIIGGFVDVVKKEKISTEKAATEGIKSYSLPFDDYVKWKSGSKSLTINQVFEIMLAVKNTGDWKKAFKSIPIRKAQNMNSVEDDHSNLIEKLAM